MDNKKLLKFILKDLDELEELIAEKGSNNFDELEWEFLQTRVGGAKRMIKILFDREELNSSENDSETGIADPEIQQEKVEEPPLEETFVEEKKEGPIVETLEEKHEEISEEVPPAQDTDREEKSEIIIETPLPENDKEIKSESESNLELDDEEPAAENKKTLGDRFSKEKSVNDIVDSNKTNLEQKLSNRPVTNIKSSIGINDRFQFIRELFDGDADVYLNAVSDLDQMNNIQEAVGYLQQNFKWKKNETSLKFVNLVKRRFTNE